MGYIIILHCDRICSAHLTGGDEHGPLLLLPAVCERVVGRALVGHIKLAVEAALEVKARVARCEAAVAERGELHTLVAVDALERAVRVRLPRVASCALAPAHRAALFYLERSCGRFILTFYPAPQKSIPKQEFIYRWQARL